jgi:multiple antibiotic resistance protein
MPLLSIALTLFLTANPLGNSAAIISLINNQDYEKKKWIMLRESLLSYALALFFLFFGTVFLAHFSIECYTLPIFGGILMLLFSLDMIFKDPFSPKTAQNSQQDPFFVPIATPLITGPGVLAMIMLYASHEEYVFTLFLAITLAWIGIAFVLFISPSLFKKMRKEGIKALEHFMGFILLLMGVQMILRGVSEYIHFLKGS